MEDVGNLVKTSLIEIERMLSTKTVVGEPIAIEGRTIIPLISIGFGFGAFGGSGRAEKIPNGEGASGVTSGGGGIKPVAIIIMSKEGVMVEPIKGSTTSVLEKLGEVVGRAMEKQGEKKS